MRFRIPFSIVFSWLLAFSAPAQDLQKTKDLADGFYVTGQAENALYTYQRAAFFSPEGADADLLLKIAECFDLEGDFERSLEYYDHAYFSGPSDSLKTEILFKKANALIRTGNYNFALIELLGMDTEDGSHTDRRKALYLASSYYGLADFVNAEAYFIQALKGKDPETEEKISEIFSKRSNFYRPNPSTAMWLSVFIPGTGQFYSGDWQAGINSFLLTGSLVSLTFYLTRLYHPIDAILTALPWFQRYYQGGFGQAEIIAGQKRQKKRALAYSSIVKIIAQQETIDK